jgi:hypothetical protein
VPCGSRSRSSPLRWQPTAPVRHFAFVSLDDQVYVTNNPHVRAGLTWTGIVWAFTTYYAANWHPLTWISHMVDVQIFGPIPGPPHVVNLVLHTINVLLLWLVCRRLTGSVFQADSWRRSSGCIRCTWNRSLGWRNGRTFLSTCFALLMMWTYAGYVRRPGLLRYAGAWLLFALALMAKPMFVTLPFVLLLLDAWPLGRIAGFVPSANGQPTLTLVADRPREDPVFCSGDSVERRDGRRAATGRRHFIAGGRPVRR